MDIETIVSNSLESKQVIENIQNEDLVFKNLHICKHCEHPRCNNIIIVYCRPKVGSSSLVTSLNLSLSNKYRIFHLHNNKAIKRLYNIQDITIIDVINILSKYKQNIFIIDIYRNTFDTIVSHFFQEINIHFSIKKNDVDTLLDNDKIMLRFNETMYLSLTNNAIDYYSEIYNNNIKVDTFDFDKKYLKYVEGNKTYIKVRLNDFELWSTIFEEIFNENIYILKDNSTSTKAYSTFKKEYKIPNNLLKMLLINMQYEKIYLSKFEQEEYINYLTNKTNVNNVVRCFNKEECIIYSRIIMQNILNREEKLDKNHYLVTNCNCNKCISNNNEIKEMMSLKIQTDVIFDTLIERKQNHQSSNQKHSSCSTCYDKKQQVEQQQVEQQQVQQQQVQQQQTQQNKHALGRLLFK